MYKCYLAVIECVVCHLTMVTLCHLDNLGQGVPKPSMELGHPIVFIVKSKLHYLTYNRFAAKSPSLQKLKQ